jgi:uncharacterized protein YcgI (DUF1989 family)
VSHEHTLLKVPARRGRAVRLSNGQSLKIVNTHGHLVCETLGFCSEVPLVFMSMEHTRPTLGKIFPTKGDFLYSNRRRPILFFAEDTSPGNHDTIIAACDDYRYGLLGCTEYHDNCTDNLIAAMRAIHAPLPEVPQPLNLWMNIPVHPDGRIEWGAPLSKPGDYVVLRAEMDVVIAMSACPQDILPINGNNPVEVQFETLN